MEIIIAIVAILIIIDIYSRLKNHTRYAHLVVHLIVLMNRYEKILLKKKLITPEDIRYTRAKIEAGMSEKEFARLKEMAAVFDPDWSMLSTALIREFSGEKEEKELREILNEAIYYKDHGALMRFLKRVEEKNIKESSPDNPFGFIKDKYGKDFFTE